MRPLGLSLWVNRVVSCVSWWRLLNPNDRTYLTGIGDPESDPFQTHPLQQSLGVAPSRTGLLGAFVLPNPGHEQLPDHS